MELPRYCIVGSRPVVAIKTEDGGMDVLAYDWATGELVRDMGYLTRIALPDEEVEIVSADEFEAYVLRLRSQRSQ